ncbi:MAG: hypothetical protein WB988_02300 [Candidatus Nitrosopolaris sp.]
MNTREILKMGVIATEWGNSTHIVTPKEWKGKKVVCWLKSEWDEMRRGKK